MRDGWSETAAGPESTAPGTVFQPDHAAPSHVTHPTSPDGVRTKTSSVPARRVVAAGALCVRMPPGIWAQPLQADPFHASRYTKSFVPRTITSSRVPPRETSAGADRVRPGSSAVVFSPVQPEPATHDLATIPLSGPR